MPNNKKKQQQKKKKNQKKMSNSQMVVRPKMMMGPRSIDLSPCAKKYLLAISNAFDPRAEGACVPSFPARQTQKEPVRVRFTAAIGTGGVGWVLISPSAANDAPLAWVTSSNFAGVSAGFVPSGTGQTTTVGVSALYAPTPYTWAQLGPQAYDADIGSTGILFRLVSCAVRMSYTGKLVDRGGSWYNYVSPNHGNLAGATLSNIGGRPTAYIGPITDSPVYMVTSACQQSELDFVDTHQGTGPGNDYANRKPSVNPFSNGYAIDATSQTGNWFNGAAPMLLMFTGTPGNTFQGEIIMHLEYLGGAASTFATPNSVDPMGLAIVQSASDKLEGDTSSFTGSQLFQRMYKYVGDSLREMSFMDAVRFGRNILQNSRRGSNLSLEF